MRKIIEVENELEQMRTLCESERRSPTDREKQRAKKLLDEIDEIRTEEAANAISPRSLTRPGTVGGVSGTPAAGGDFRSLGDQAAAVIAASQPGGFVNPLLHNLNKRAALGLNETVSSDGGFMVAPTLSSEIMSTVWEQPILKLLRKIQIGANSNGLKIPGLDETSRVSGSRWGGIQSYYISESDAITPSKPKFKQIELSLKKLAVLTYLTSELSADVPALSGFLRTVVTSEFEYEIQRALLRGSGAGQPQGLLTAGCLITTAKEGGQANGSVCWENIVNMFSRFLMTDKKSSAWLISKDVLPQLLQMAASVGTAGIPVWLPANSGSNEPFQTLLGLPIHVCECCSALGTKGDIFLADLSQMVCIEKGNLKEDFSIHVAFSSDQGCLRWIYRYDLQPALSAAITPSNGGATLSPFVTLAAR